MSVVRLSPAPSPLLDGLSRRAAGVAYAGPDGRPDVSGALRLARDLGDELGGADPAALLPRWEALATLGATDLTVARAAEPHLDAVAILTEAGERQPLPEATWGVYAAEGPQRLHAVPDGDAWRLDGVKSWCSLASEVSHALVTAWVGDERRDLFLVDLDDPGVAHVDAPWVSRGLAAVRSTGLQLAGVTARRVGGPGWYLERPGFWWGGIGVAAVWYGATVALARRVRHARARREPDQLALAHLGAVDAQVATASAALREAAGAAASGIGGADVPLVAARTRQLVSNAARQVLATAATALGPAPLVAEEEHARRVTDLEVYLRQHHGDRDLAALGAQVLAAAPDATGAWW